jgi:hypothetical protein
MPRLLLVAVFLLAAMPAGADCIANGHFTIISNAVPLLGTRFPYTEDLASRRDAQPIPSSFTVSHHEDGRWTKIQTGCVSSGERNISASTAVNLLLRASFRINAHTAPPEARYEIQLRLDDEPVLTETRRLGVVPRSDRFATVVRDVSAGNYVYSLWMRILDGPGSNSAIVDVQWITAQGMPNSFAADREISSAQHLVNAMWIKAGQPIHFSNDQPLDLVLQSSFTVEEADSDAVTMEVGFTVDDELIFPAGLVAIPTILPDSLVTFDTRSLVPPGQHTLHLWLRTTLGQMRVSGLRTEMAGMPSRIPDLEIFPMVRAEEREEIEARAGEGEEPPPSLDTVCGQWTKLLRFELPASGGLSSWNLEGYVEVLDTDVSGYGQIAIVVEHRQQLPDGGLVTDAVTDMGILEIQARPGGDGFFFYGDASKWGNFPVGDEMSLWIRRMEGCRSAPFGGSFRVGRRWLAVKLLPSEGPHLQ